MDEFNNKENEQENVQEEIKPDYIAKPVDDVNEQKKNEMTEGKGISIGAMVCGILSIVILFLNTWASLCLAIVGIVLGIIGIKQGNKGFAITGIVCGIIAIVLHIIFVRIVYGIIRWIIALIISVAK